MMYTTQKYINYGQSCCNFSVFDDIEVKNFILSLYKGRKMFKSATTFLIIHIYKKEF